MRSAIDPATLGRAADRAVLEVTGDMWIGDISTADGIRGYYSETPRFFSWLLAAFAGTALALAVVGVFGVTSRGAPAKSAFGGRWAPIPGLYCDSS